MATDWLRTMELTTTATLTRDDGGSFGVHFSDAGGAACGSTSGVVISAVTDAAAAHGLHW